MKKLYAMKLVIFIGLLSLNALTSMGQILTIKGTYFIAAIGADGVMIAIDTRATLFHEDAVSKKRETLAYWDQAQKSLISQGNKIIAIKGISNFDEHTIIGLIRKFERSVNHDIPVSNYLNLFIPFLKKEISAELFNRVSNEESFVIAGYEKTTPVVCMWNKYYQNYCIGGDHGYFDCDSSSDFASRYNPKFTCEKLGEIAKEVIYKYSKDHNKEMEIGGPIEILKVSGNKTVWLHNKPIKEYLFCKDIYKDLLDGRLNLTNNPSYDRKIALDLINNELLKVSK